ncbi:MAG TPA: MFS transporter [Thermoplasmata archaeon]|nr:MFS transporter [Thermoplasmata archaeon]
MVFYLLPLPVRTLTQKERGLGRSIRGLGRNVILLGIVSLLADVSSEMVNPIIPIYLTVVLAASPDIVGLIMGAADSLGNLLKVVMGWYSDRVRSRKPFIALGYAPAAVVRPLMALATSWVDILGIRLVDRAGKGVRTAPRDALIADSVPPARRGAAFGLHRALDSAGAIIGTSIAIFLLMFFLGSTQTDDMRTIFIISAIPAALSVLVVILFVREKEVASMPGRRKSFFASLRGVDSRLKRFLVVVAFIGFANVGFAFFVLRAIDFNATLVETLLAYLLMNVTYTFFSIPAGVVADRIGRKKMIAIGLVVFILGALVMAFSTSLLFVFFGFLIYGTFLAIADVNQGAFASMLSKKTDRGTVMGAYHTVAGMTALPAGFLFGTIWKDFGVLAAFGFAAGMAVIALVILLAFITEPREDGAAA